MKKSLKSLKNLSVFAVVGACVLSGCSDQMAQESAEAQPVEAQPAADASKEQAKADALEIAGQAVEVYAPHSPVSVKSLRSSLGEAGDLRGGRILVKFKNGSTDFDGSDVMEVAGGDAVTKQLEQAGKVQEIEPVFAGLLGKLKELRSTRRFGRVEQADLAQWYSMYVPAGVSLTGVIDKLQRDELVEIAYLDPKVISASLRDDGGLGPGDGFKDQDIRRGQTYGKGSRFWGIDAEYAHTFKGGKGEGVTYTDIENGWNAQHEDISKLREPGVLIDKFEGASMNRDDSDHGTPVVSILSADHNDVGINGLLPAAKVQVASGKWKSLAPSHNNLKKAILRAIVNSEPGDVILLEYQLGGVLGQPSGGCHDPSAQVGTKDSQVGYLPLEYSHIYNDLIRFAVSIGIHVVEPAGNGSQNFDDPCFDVEPGRYAKYRHRTGAIMVGAGSAPHDASYEGQGFEKVFHDLEKAPGVRMGFSNYGRHVHLQGWGQTVSAAGHAGKGLPEGMNSDYTLFSGTSSASPIVASAVGAISGIAKAHGMSVNPLVMRELLVRTGTWSRFYNPQEHIGPLPNLRRAIPRLLRLPYESETEWPVEKPGWDSFGQ